MSKGAVSIRFGPWRSPLVSVCVMQMELGLCVLWSPAPPASPARHPMTHSRGYQSVSSFSRDGLEALSSFRVWGCSMTLIALFSALRSCWGPGCGVGASEGESQEWTSCKVVVRFRSFVAVLRRSGGWSVELRRAHHKLARSSTIGMKAAIATKPTRVPIKAMIRGSSIEAILSNWISTSSS